MIIALFSTIAWAAVPSAPFPVFLKAGFSSVLEFDEIPSRIVLGDAQKFQVEKLDHSLVIKTLTPFAATNMFVYFHDVPPRLFVLTASEDAQPTFYKSFTEPPAPPKKTMRVTPTASQGEKGGRLLSAKFDAKKDYLTVDCVVQADSSSLLRPSWSLVRLIYSGTPIAPLKVWAERKDVQKNAAVRARFIFAKPNIPRDLAGTSLVIPLEGSLIPIRIKLKGGNR